MPFSAYKHPAFLAVVGCNARRKFPSLGNKVHREIRKRRIDWRRTRDRNNDSSYRRAKTPDGGLPQKFRQADDKIHNEKGD